MGRILGGEVLLDKRAQSGEDLSGRQIRGQAVDDAEGRLNVHGSVLVVVTHRACTYSAWSIVIHVRGLFFSGDGHQTFQHGRTKIQPLNLRLFAVQMHQSRIFPNRRCTYYWIVQFRALRARMRISSS